MPKLADKIYDDFIEEQLSGKNRTRRQSMINAGFSATTADKNGKQKTIRTKAYKDALKRKGIDLKQAKHLTAQMLEVPLKVDRVMPDDQLRAADQVYRLEGAYATEKFQVVNVDLVSLYLEAQKLKKEKETGKEKEELNNATESPGLPAP